MKVYVQKYIVTIDLLILTFLYFLFVDNAMTFKQIKQMYSEVRNDCQEGNEIMKSLIEL